MNSTQEQELPSAIMGSLFQWREINAIRKDAKGLPKSESTNVFVFAFGCSVKTGRNAQRRLLYPSPENVLLYGVPAKRPRGERPARGDDQAAATLLARLPRINIGHHP
jgi:hypothetical protein